MPFAQVASVGLRLFARDELSGALTRVSQKWGGFFNMISGGALGQSAAALRAGGTQAALAMGMLGPIAMEASAAIDKWALVTTNAVKSVLKSAAEYETVLMRVGVVSGTAADGMQDLSKEILKVTADLPTSATELARATLAFSRMGFTAQKTAKQIAQMGMRAVEFGRAIGVSDEQAAMFIGKLATWLAIGEPTDTQMDRLAGTVTKLGWRIKGTAVDVIKATERFGAFVRAMGASEDQTLALAALVQDSGILIRRGSTAINRTFQLMSINAGKFGDALAKSGVIAKSEDFVKTFRTDPVEAFRMVLQSLEGQHGANASIMLKQLGLHGNYISDLITMSRNLGRFGMLLRESNAEFNKGQGELSASRKAYEEQMKTYAAATKVFWGAMENLKIVLGSALLTPLAEILKVFADWAKQLLEMDEGLLQFGGVVLLIIAGLGVFIKYVKTAVVVVKAFQMAQMAMMAGLSKWFFIILAVIVAIVVGYAAIRAYAKKAAGEQASVTEELKRTTDEMKKASSQVVGGLTGGLMGPGAEGGADTAVPGGPELTANERSAADRLAGVNPGGTALPGMQHGGIAIAPTPVVVAEREPEGIIPISQLPSLMAAAIRMAQPEQPESVGGQVSVSVNLDSGELARASADQEMITRLRRGMG